MKVPAIAVLSLSIVGSSYSFGLMGNRPPRSSPLISSATSSATSTATGASVISNTDLVVDLESELTTDTPELSINTQEQNKHPLEEISHRILHEHHLGSIPDSLWDVSIPMLYALANRACPAAAFSASYILKRLEQEQDATDNRELSVMHYGVVAHAWAKSDHPQAGEKAQAVLDNMMMRSDLQPNRILLNSVMHAWGRQGKVERAETIFERIRKEMELDIMDYNALLSAYARHGDALKVENLLKEMTDKGIEPNIISYNTLLDAWSKSNEAGAAQRAENILETLHQNHASGLSDLQPDGLSYLFVISAYTKSGRSDSLAQAERLMSLAEERDLPIESYMYPYNAVLDAWAMSGHDDAAVKAEAILNDMERKGRVNTVSYNTVIKAYKMSNLSDVAERAEALLNRMEDSKLWRILPDVFTYTSVIQCYAKGGDASKAVALFNRMVESCRAGNECCKPNTITVNAVLDALAKQGNRAQEAHELLNSLLGSKDSCLNRIQLNAVSFNCVIDACAKNGGSDAAIKAEEIFRQQEEEYARGNDDAKPKTFTYNTLMNAWVQSGKKGSIQRAEAILNRMETEYSSGNEDVRPDAISYSVIMNGWSKLRDPSSLENTARVFKQMLNAYQAGNVSSRPNLHSYVAYLVAIVNSKTPEAPEEAEKLLMVMYKDYCSGNKSAKPNALAITQVIDCWGKSGRRDAGERAEALLDWMLKLYDEQKDESFKPNQMTWNAVVNAWAKSRVFGKANRAKEVLDRMVTMYESGDRSEAARPNHIVYTAVVNAAAYTVGDEAEKLKAFQIATNTLKDMEHSKYGKPNQVTYATYVTACQRLIPDGSSRKTSVEAAFKKCCKDGMVDDMVLQRIKSALTTEQLRELFQNPEMFAKDGNINVKNLPREWGSNVKDLNSKKPHENKRNAKRT